MIEAMRRSAPLACAILLALAIPAASLADHVSINASIDANLIERTSSGTWRVDVGWPMKCLGAGPSGGLFQGNLYSIDVHTGKRFYLGLVSGPGSESHYYWPEAEPRSIAFELTISCFDNITVHGSDTLVIASNTVLIPAKDGDLGDGSGGSGGGGGDDGGSGGRDATEPLAGGGCQPAILGTTGDDELPGGGKGEVMFGLGGNDKIFGRGGHDCLIGGPGADTLKGHGGRDRLTGGTGKDKLYGGPGVNAYDAGPGADYVSAVNRRRETVDCGSGVDRARVDRRDRVRRCEHVTRVR